MKKRHEHSTPIVSVMRAIRSVVRAEVRMRVKGSGDYSAVERAHARLAHALGRISSTELQPPEGQALLRDVKRLGEIC